MAELHLKSWRFRAEREADWRRLETLLTKVTAKSFEHPLVDACRVRVMKPEIFSRAGGAGVEWFRTRPS